MAKMTDDLKEVTNKHINSIQALEAKVSNTEGEVSRVNKKISNNMDKKSQQRGRKSQLGNSDLKKK